MEYQNNIGVVGLGSMGSGIALSLISKVRKIGVFDIDRDKMKPLASFNVDIYNSVEELVESCRTIFLSLPTSKVTVEVIENNILPTIRENQTIIDTGTTIVNETRRLFELLKKRGAQFIDAPVSGGTIGSATGQLYCFVGGEANAVRERWSELSDIATERLTYCGSSGSGQVAKCVNQLSMGLVSAAYLEAIAFGVTSGVDASVLLNAVGGSEGFRLEFSRYASRVIENKADGMDHKSAEFEYFLDEADRSGFKAPLLRTLNNYLEHRPKDFRDNMGRAYASFWSALVESKEGKQ